MQSSLTTMLIIPTGIGASIGGYAGDAIPVARAIAAVSDCLITHPNVLNGAQLYWPMENTLYVEGYGLDQFSAGRWGLRPVLSNRIGLLLDQGIEADLKIRHLQVADAARATLGLTLSGVIETDCALGVRLKTAPSGTSWGTLAHPDSLFRAAETLIEQGAEAIAVVARFPDDPDSEGLAAYRQGHGVDPLAGAEAVMSHLIVKKFHIPCAHAPALSPLPLDITLDPRAAAEELGYTFLPSVLAGLSRAPQFELNPAKNLSVLSASQVDALIIPDSCCGSSSVLSLAQTPTRIITVSENQTELSVSPDDLGLPVTRTHTYLEAIGVLAAMKAGLDPRSITGKRSISLSGTLGKEILSS